MSNYAVRWKRIPRVVRTLIVLVVYVLVVCLVLIVLTVTPFHILAAFVGLVLVTVIVYGAWELVDL